MSRKVTSPELSSSENNDDISSEDQQKRTSRRTSKTNSIKNYVTDVLTKREQNTGHPTDLSQAEVKIQTTSNTFGDHENISAFRRYQTNADGTPKVDATRSQSGTSTSGNGSGQHTPIEQSGELDDSLAELNLDPNPVYEERESHDQVYKQKVYLRQLQPPTPQPVEIQVQEILIKPQMQKRPIHVRVDQREPRTPSPIVIKTAPPQPPPIESQEPIVYNKYLPPPKQPPQQIIIHRYPELPPKPRPIVVEQWLPYKPAPKRIIKHSLPREALQTPPPPHNIIISYSKPRAVIELELVRLPVVKIDPQTYEQISSRGQNQLIQHPTFQHEQNYISANRTNRPPQGTNQINWRI